MDGAGDRSRTYDLRITNALLYQLSYTGEGGIIRFCRKQGKRQLSGALMYFRVSDDAQHETNESIG